MAMEDEYDPFDVGGQGYVSTGGPGRGTAASQLGYTSDQVYGGGGGDGDDNNRFIARPGAGLTKAQFEKTYGITDRNPFGRRPSGFAAFLDKFNRSLGGKGIDYSQQFRDLDRLHNRRPGTSAARFRQRQYDLYRNPEITADGRIKSGGIDRAGRGTYQGPVEMVTREMGPGEQLVRTGIGSVPFAGPFLSGIGTEDPYLSSKVTDEMRARENQSLAEQLIGGLNLGDTIESIANKGSSMIERLQGLASGNQQPAQAFVPSGPAMGSRDPSREIGPLAQTIPAGLTNQDEVAAMAMMPAEMITAEAVAPQGPMMPAESDPRLSENTVANMLRDPSPEPKVFDSTLIDQLVAEQQEKRDRASAQREANRDISLELLPGMLGQAIADSEARKMAQTEELDSVAPRPEMTPAEMLREIISQPPSPRTGGQAQVAELDYPELSKIIELGRQLATGEDLGGSTKIFGGDLGVTFSPGDRGIGFQFRKELQDKDMGAKEFLNFLNRITS